MSRFNLKNFKPGQMDIPGRDSTKLAYWILEQDSEASYQEALEAAKKLGLSFSGRSWGTARQLLDLSPATGAKKKRRKKKGRRARKAVAAAPVAAPTKAPVRATRSAGNPIDAGIARVEAAEKELAAVKESLNAIRKALLGI
ncbi:MAG: hypothetical protein CSA62_04495 [Planctomycetota bacterium]|nr:MAG: hypothetical protein CSA62_04495 [Planctomycetota bacterium]